MRTIRLFLLIFIITTPAMAATVYVDGDHTGTENGESWSTPYNTIAEGIAALSSGDTLIIKSGTYAEYMFFDQPNFASETTVQTDDGNGNPGVVTLTGRISGGGAQRVIYIHNGGNLTIDGRQSEMEGDSDYGFVLNPSSAACGVYANEASARGNLKILRVEVVGSKCSGDNGTIELAYDTSPEVAYCRADQAGGNDGDVIIVYGDSGQETTSGSIHHNDVQGHPSDGYGLIYARYVNDFNIYSNYIHDGSSTKGEVAAIRLRDTQGAGADAGDIYNNVIYDNLSDMDVCIQLRGFSEGSGGTDGAEVFNNTCHGSFSWAAFVVNDGSDNNKFFNNLVIGGPSYWVSNWGDNQGTGNELYNNVATGNVGSTFDSGVSGMFSVNTANTENQGTAFINQSGDRPSPYYDLSASKDGTGSVPTIDYDSNARSAPPDVGAYEYGSGTTPRTIQGITINGVTIQ